ncbi:MAG: sigma-54-dependent Fis family transcriptional regulator [Nitrospirae bacterium]|nr:sigma-54-dependent Fis family transcriptional regulator [Nitrospirota bacterium]NTW66706.1 sigma-54-dependent Fis family transcriptional regulator [Nitrospirota bacterium]
MNNILVVDDEEPFRRLLKNELARKGCAVSVAADGGEALRLMRENPFDAILLDVVMPGVDGLSLMKKLKEDPSAPPIVVLTGKATVETAVEAMKNGAYDYLTKPYKLDELAIVVDRACEYGRLSVKSKLLEQELVRKESPFEFVGTSRQLKDILALIRKVAPTDSPVFIQGESGTGKELVANTVWHYSKRKDTPFIALNCASLSESLIESEIFGHEKGAFTSAYQLKHGLVEVADTGTLFLDEIGEMPIGLQAKLLRFLDSGEFRRVGGNKALTVDVRLIAATNKDLAAMIKQGTFREDLYYRLNVINITLPPLRERKEDIAALARHFLKQYAKKLDKSITDLTSDALELLAGYHWPGNVRELENVVERAVILCESNLLGAEDLSVPTPAVIAELGTNPSLEEMEKNYILRVLKEANGNQSRASQLLGIDRKTLYLKLKKYGIQT